MGRVGEGERRGVAEGGWEGCGEVVEWWGKGRGGIKGGGLARRL